MVLKTAYHPQDDKFKHERFDPRDQFFGRVAAVSDLTDENLATILLEESFQKPQGFGHLDPAERFDWCVEINEIADFGAVFVRHLSETEHVQRLKNELQSPSSAFTAIAKNSSYGFTPFGTTRFDHTISACDEAFKLAINSNYGTYEVLLSLAVATLHDIGHIAFSHTGEEILRAMGFSEFDHDLYGALLASDPEYKSIFEHAGLDHKDVVAALIGPKILEPGMRERFEVMTKKLSSIMDKDFSFALDLESPEDIARIEKFKGLHVLVQDYADMFAYGKTDIAHSPFNTKEAKRYVSLIDEAVSVVSETEGGTIEASSLEPLRKFQGIYVNYSTAYPLSHAAATAGAFLIREIPKAGISIKDLLTKSQGEIMEMLPKEAQDICNIDGIDAKYLPAIKIRPPLRLGFSNRDLKEKVEDLVKSLIAKGMLPEDFDGLICPTPPIKKSFNFKLRPGNLRGIAGLAGRWGEEPRPTVDIILNKHKYRATDQIEMRLSTVDGENIAVNCNSVPTLCVSLKEEDLSYAKILGEEIDKLFSGEFLIKLNQQKAA